MPYTLITPTCLFISRPDQPFMCLLFQERDQTSGGKILHQSCAHGHPEPHTNYELRFQTRLKLEMVQNRTDRVTLPTET